MASRDIEAGATLWQEQPVIVCSSMDAAAAPAVQADSPEERAFAAVLPALPSQLCAPDVLLTLHAMRRLRLFGRRSRLWTLMQQLQSKPADDDADVAAPSSAAEAPSQSASPSRFQQRFKVLAAAAQQIFEALQQQLVAVSASSSSAGSDPAAAADPNAVVVDARTIEQFLGMLQLNAHRTAKLPTPEVDGAASDAPPAAASSAVAPAVAAAGPAPSGKALSLRLSMLEHDCSPNLDFSSEWVDSSALSSAAAVTPLDQADERLVSVGVQGPSVLFASSARCPLPAASSMLVLSLRSLRAISAGECLSISYYPCRVRTVVRQAHLRGLYGFECRCGVCVGRDHSRAFWCCFDDEHEQENATAHDEVIAASAAPPRRPRCTGVLTPVGLGQRFSDYSCALCGRAFTSEAQYQRLLAVEQSMRAGVDQPSASSESSFNLRPHPSHYLHALKRKPNESPAVLSS